YLESLGWKFTSTKDQKVRLRADELPLGRLVVQISRHLVAVIDGVIHDTYDSGGEGRVRVKGYWRAASWAHAPPGPLWFPFMTAANASVLSSPAAVAATKPSVRMSAPSASSLINARP